NKSATELTLEEFMDESHQADAFKQDRIFDLFITLNQTRAEKKCNIGRGYIAKTRNGISKVDFNFKSHFKDQTLKFQEISRSTYMNEMTKLQENDTDHTQTTIDKINVGKKFEPSDGELVD